MAVANGKPVNLSLDLKTASLFIEEVNSLVKRLERLRERISLAFPAREGSDLWWQKAEEEVDRELSLGRIQKAENVKGLIKELEK